MKNTLNITASFLLIVGALLWWSQAQAQFQVNGNGNYVAPTESGASFSDGLWGGGVTFRYFITPNWAVGLNGRYFTKSNSTDFSVGTGVAGTVKATGNLLMVTAQAEYFFSASALRPYIGLEAGLYQSAASVELTSGYQTAKSSGSASDFGLAPKVGLQYAISPAFGVSADAGYHLVFSGSDTGKSLLLGAGVYVRFGQR